MIEMDALISDARRHHQPHVHEKYALGPGCTVRAVTFGDNSGIPYLLPEGWTPVMSEDGSRVTLKDDTCKRCESLEARVLVLEEMLSPSKVHGDSWSISVREK